MRYLPRPSWGCLLAVLLSVAAALPPACLALQRENESPQAQSRIAPTEPKALYQALNALQPDPSKVYDVKEINLVRDVVHLTLQDGKLAFFLPLDGKITGAVFYGQGHVIATPRDPGERRSLAQYLGVPILDMPFTRAYLRFDDDTAAELQSGLSRNGAEAANNPEFADGWTSIVASLNPWHSLRLLVDWLSTKTQPYFYAALAGDTKGAFDVLVDTRRDEQVVFGQPRIENGTVGYDVWASFPAENQKTATAPPAFVPTDYRVDTTIDDDLSLEGVTHLSMKVMRPGERVVPLLLSRNLAIERITSDDGKALVYFQNEDLNQRQIQQRGNDSVMVVLPTPPAEGQEVRMDVKYRGDVIGDAGNGVEFVGDRGTWYAHLDGEYFVPFQLSFRWPKRFTLVATGAQIESQEDDNSKSGSWKSQLPMSVAGFNLGEYDAETEGAGPPKIQLFANRQLENAILARIEENTAEAQSLAPPNPNSQSPARLSPFLNPPTPPSPSSVLKDLGAEVESSIHFFEKLNGPFPFDQLDISQIPGSFGQGWPGLVYLSTLAFLPPETQQSAGIGTVEQEEARELMPFHEIVHQWWGNETGSASYRDDWIQEGMANYLAILYADSRNPSKHRLNTWLERYRAALLRKDPATNEIADDAGPLDEGIRLSSSKTPNAYVVVTYDKGTWVMHMLHELLRDPNSKDPDELFRQFLQLVLTNYRFCALSTDNFQHAVEQMMTPSMDLEGDKSMKWFFDEWVRRTGIPSYSVQFQAKQRKQEYVITGKLDQADVADEFIAPVPIYGARSGMKPWLLGVVVTSGQETAFQFETHTRPTRLLIDPQMTLLHRTN
jgi:Peptidase family M1 domain